MILAKQGAYHWPQDNTNVIGYNASLFFSELLRMYKVDQLFVKPQHLIPAFQFDEQVATVFADMISRSVPGYHEILSGIRLITARFAQEGTDLYDLGCALGASMLAMDQGLTKKKNCHLWGVDQSSAMLQRAQTLLSQTKMKTPFTLTCADLCTTEINNASIVVLNFTLQFVPPQQRQAIVNKIYQSLCAGGVLVLSEKFDHPKHWNQQLLIDLHHDFKHENGYSALEISQKRNALENVLVPDTQAVHQERLRQAGFQHIQLWYQFLNFGSFLAVK